MHICIPYSENFIKQVKEYKETYKPSVTVIHSTVPVGTSDKLGACHSPVRGIHPNLEEGVRTFVKYFGGKGSVDAAKEFFSRGVACMPNLKAIDTELLKLWDTTIYGLNIMIEKEVFEHCKKLGANFDVIYGHANQSYNEGYRELGHPEYQKYVLKHVDGPIGGHCVIPNLPLLDHPLGNILATFNAGHKPALTPKAKGRKMKS